MNSEIKDAMDVRRLLQVFCEATRSATIEIYSIWQKLARGILLLLQSNNKHVVNCAFELSAIAHCLANRMMNQPQRFPKYCLYALQLLRKIHTMHLDDPTRKFLDPPTQKDVEKFLASPEKHYFSDIQEETEDLKECVTLFQAKLENHTRQIIQESKAGFPDQKYISVINIENFSQVRQLYNDHFSLCLLDLSGNFLFCDNNSKKVFGRAIKDLIGKNLFHDLMIPFSLALMRKKYNGDLSMLFEGKLATTFSYSIYSTHKANEYKRTAIENYFDPLNKNLTRQEAVNKHKKLQEFLKGLKQKLSEKDSLVVYENFLDCLTSRASLVDLQMTSTEIEQLFSKKYDEEHLKAAPGKILRNFFKGVKLDAGVVKTVILLQTRRAEHIQKLPYHLMTKDPKIEKLLQKIGTEIEKNEPNRKFKASNVEPYPHEEEFKSDREEAYFEDDSTPEMLQFGEQQHFKMVSNPRNMGIDFTSLFSNYSN